MNSRVVALILQVKANLLGYGEKPGILGKHFLRALSEGDLRLRESIPGIRQGDCKFKTEAVRHERQQQGRAFERRGNLLEFIDSKQSKGLEHDP